MAHVVGDGESGVLPEEAGPRVERTGGAHEELGARAVVLALPEHIPADPGEVRHDGAKTAEHAEEDPLSDRGLEFPAADFRQGQPGAPPSMVRERPDREEQREERQPRQGAAHAQISLRRNRNVAKVRKATT